MWFLSLSACFSTSVTGVVVDGLTGEPMNGVTVTVAGTTLATTSEADGTYTVSKPASGPQKLEFKATGYVTPKPLELTLESGHRTEAVPMKLFPAYDNDRAFMIRDGKPIEFAVLGRDEWSEWRRSGGFGYFPYNAVDARVFRDVPYASETIQVVAHLASHNVAPVDLRTHKFKHNPNAQRMAHNRPQVITEPNYTLDSAVSSRPEVTSPVPGWYTFDLAPLPNYRGVVIVNPYASDQEGFLVFMDDTPAVIVETEGVKGLQVKDGDYNSRMQPWRLALEVVRAYCATNPDKCSEVAEDLARDITDVKGDCFGRLMVTGNGDADFWNVQCAGDMTRAVLRFDQSTKSYQVQRVFSGVASFEAPYLYPEDSD